MAQTLLEKGFRNVHPVYGGFEAWQRAGYPVEPKLGDERPKVR